MELIIKENLLGKFIYVFKMILKYGLVRYLSHALLIFLKIFKYVDLPTMWPIVLTRDFFMEDTNNKFA
jgi:hypothetical protein